MSLDTFRKSLLIIGPLFAITAGVIFPSLGLPEPAAWTAGITIWVGLWWVFEPIPIPATSLIPFAAFPMTGVLSNKEVAQAYGHWLIMLLLGGFILSTAMEKSGVHRRIALFMIELAGKNSPKRMILGVMLATGFLSGWISNTATVLMMLPVVLALCAELPGPKSVCAMLLGLAYSASIGGIATPIGTPPNIVLMGVYEETVGASIGFLDWMLLGYPISLILLVFTWIFLTRNLEHRSFEASDDVIQSRAPMSIHERRVLVIFALTALAWITRKQPQGGWSELIGAAAVGDDTIALAAAALVFVVPNGSGGKVLDWETAVKIPWGLLILFGGGIAIAKAFGASGLSGIIGQSLIGVTTLPVLLMMIIVCSAVTFLTEMTSNTATTTLLMPILAAAALAVNIEPILLMLPAALSASCAFMLPVATAPNAIVFGSGRVTVENMVKEGFWLNIIGIFVISLSCFLGCKILLPN